MTYESKTYRMTTSYPTTSDAKGWDYIRLVDEYYDEKDTLMADVLRLADEHKCLLILDVDAEVWTDWHYLHPSLRVDGYQLTHADDRGPIGHDDVMHDPHKLAHDLPDHFECWYIR